MRAVLVLLSTLLLAACGPSDRPGMQDAAVIEVAAVYDASYAALFNDNVMAVMNHISSLLYMTGLRFDSEDMNAVNISLSLVRVTQADTSIAVAATNLKELSQWVDSQEGLRKLDVVLIFTTGSPDKDKAEENVLRGTWCGENAHIAVVHDDGESARTSLLIAKDIAFMMDISPDPPGIQLHCGFDRGYIVGKMDGNAGQASWFSYCSRQEIAAFIRNKTAEYPFCFIRCHKDLKFRYANMTPEGFCDSVEPGFAWTPSTAVEGKRGGRRSASQDCSVRCRYKHGSRRKTFSVPNGQPCITAGCDPGFCYRGLCGEH